jgi:hypothetical protein
MSELNFVNALGEPFDVDAARARAKESGGLKPRRAQAAARSENPFDNVMTLGWIVEGFTRDMVDAAKSARLKAIEQYAAAKAEGLKWEGRPPQTWDEEQWLHTAKAAKVRTRPFEIRAAAQELADLAMRQGWVHVRVSEIRRERKA